MYFAVDTNNSKMKGKGKGQGDRSVAQAASERERTTSESKDSLQFPDLKPVDHGRHCPRYTAGTHPLIIIHNVNQYQGARIFCGFTGFCRFRFVRN